MYLFQPLLAVMADIHLATFLEVSESDVWYALMCCDSPVSDMLMKEAVSSGC